jgi:hypothetical protein
VYPANIDCCDPKADANGEFDKHSESQNPRLFIAPCSQATKEAISEKMTDRNSAHLKRFATLACRMVAAVNRTWRVGLRFP